MHKKIFTLIWFWVTQKTNSSFIFQNRRGNLLELIMRMYCLKFESDVEFGCPKRFRLPEPSNMRHAAQVEIDKTLTYDLNKLLPLHLSDPAARGPLSFGLMTWNEWKWHFFFSWPTGLKRVFWYLSGLSHRSFNFVL